MPNMDQPQTAAELLDAYIDNYLGEAFERWKGWEQLAVIELVRSADYWAYLNAFAQTDDHENLRKVSLLRVHGLCAALKKLQPILDDYPDGLPWAPTNEALSSWADSLLLELGLLQMVRRLAYGERYHLTSCEIRSHNHLVITVTAENLEKFDLGEFPDAVAIGADGTLLDIADLHKTTRGWARRRIDRYVDVDRDWFIRYDSDLDLLRLYENWADTRISQSIEREALPDHVSIGGRTFGDWRRLCSKATARALLHISFATRLRAKNERLDLRNLLTIFSRTEDVEAVWAEHANLSTAAATIAVRKAFMLTPESNSAYYADTDIPLPMHLRFGKYFVLLPMFGVLHNPCTFLVKELRRQYSAEWDRAVNQREALFQKELYGLFNADHFLTCAFNPKIRGEDGREKTDIDAAVFDKTCGTLALFQLKWLDSFAHSLKERSSKAKNLSHANTWVDVVSSWVSQNESLALLSHLGMNTPPEHGSKLTVRLFVIARYNASFSASTAQDPRAAWGTWAALNRLGQGAFGENPNDLISTVWLQMRTERDNWKETIPSIPSEPVSFHFKNIRVDVHAREESF